MTMAEFNVMVDKRLAWKTLAKGCALLFTLCSAVVSAIYIPVLTVNTLKNRADESDRNAARMEGQLTELTRTVGTMQIQMAIVSSKVDATGAAIQSGFDRLQQQRTATLPARTANVPTRRTQ